MITSKLYNLRTRKGFTLVEVSIAIAVAGISLFSVVGLLPTLLDSDERSGANSVIPTLATQATAFVREARATNQSTGVPATPYIYYFNQDGKKVESTDVDATFKCEVTLRRFTDLLINTGDASLPDPGDSCLNAKMVFTWPAGSPPTPNRTKVFHSTIVTH